MNMHRLALALATFASVSFAGTANAANVGVYPSGSGATALVTAAGHTPVGVNSLDAASLNGLSALVYDNYGYSANAAIDTAVANGMTVIVHDWSVSGLTQMPGRPVTAATTSYSADLEVPSGSPIATGVGGTLTNTSLDGGNWSTHGYTNVANLPANSTVLITGVVPTQAVTFSYPVGQGRAIYSNIPIGCYYTNSGCVPATAVGMRAYMTNLIAWAAGPTFTTCAAEGYTSATKTTLCHKVCESNLTGTALTGMIKLYVATYKEQPACVR